MTCLTFCASHARVTSDGCNEVSGHVLEESWSNPGRVLHATVSGHLSEKR